MYFWLLTLCLRSRWLTRAALACTGHPVVPACAWEWLPFSFLWLNWNNKLSESLHLSTLTWAVWPRFQKSEGVGEDVRMTCLVWCSSASLSPDVPAGLWCGHSSWAAQQNKSQAILMFGFFLLCWWTWHSSSSTEVTAETVSWCNFSCFALG